MTNAKDLINRTEEIIKEFDDLKKDIKEVKNKELSKKENDYNHESAYEEVRQEMENEIKEVL